MRPCKFFGGRKSQSVTLFLEHGAAFSLLLVAYCRGDLRVSVSPSASLLASRFGSLSFSRLSFLAFLVLFAILRT